MKFTASERDRASKREKSELNKRVKLEAIQVRTAICKYKEAQVNVYLCESLQELRFQVGIFDLSHFLDAPGFFPL